MSSWAYKIMLSDVKVQRPEMWTSDRPFAFPLTERTSKLSSKIESPTVKIIKIVVLEESLLRVGVMIMGPGKLPFPLLLMTVDTHSSLSLERVAASLAAGAE